MSVQPYPSRSRLARWIVAFAIFASSLFGSRAEAWDSSPGQPNTVRPHTTLVIFADRQMDDGQWHALFNALRRNLTDGEAETRSLPNDVEIIRGDAVKPGMQVETAVVVYLHGDCKLAPLARRTAYDVPLGWVRRVDGHIEPFAHVDCTRIGKVLGPQASGMNPDRRSTVMGGAIARVILHEWIHIATQDGSHAERGMTKAKFGVTDLMTGGYEPVAALQKTW